MGFYPLLCMKPQISSRPDVFKSELVCGAQFSEVYEFPMIKKVYFKPDRAIPFDKCIKMMDDTCWVHFYQHDYKFERLWNQPSKYLNILKSFRGIITPDFSLYRELPLAMQIWNTYRNRTLAYWMQSNDINIIPNIRWGDERTYEFAFEGIKHGGTVAVSTNGCIQSRTDRHYFVKGLEKMVEKLKPDTIVNYSYTPDDIFRRYKSQGIEVIQIENYALTVRKQVV